MEAPRPGLVLELFVRASRVQKKRAVLTVAAIAWGTLALLLLLAFGEGLKRQMEEGGRGLGENIAILWPGETGRPWRGLPAGRPIRPRIEDVDLLREAMPELDGVIGELRTWSAAFTWGGRTTNGRLTGTHARYGELRRQIPVAGGRFLNPDDVRQRRRVIFLGDELARQIFGGTDPVGRTLRVNDVPYLVIGVLAHKFQMGNYAGPDTSNAVIPITTFRAQFGRTRLSNLVIRPQEPERMKAALAQLHEVLGARYRFDPADERVFGVWDTIESSRLRRNITVGLEIFLGIIGVLTLVIGGVGVANIMYAVVKERTRELGVLMALGARPSWIVWPIVLEACVYTLFGGLLGIVAGVVLVAGMGLVPVEPGSPLEVLGRPRISLPIGCVSVAVLGVIGVLAGWFPARRAARIDPAQTLRCE
ncbi:MAG: ABC transporter permease [Acidobacteria bacterium]|nr:MAG: ABC transporter permease [Acidobacteriota bacterium]